MATVTKQMIQDAHSYTITAEYAAAERITPEDATRESYAGFESAPALTEDLQSLKRGKNILSSFDIHYSDRSTTKHAAHDPSIFVSSGHIATTEAWRECWLTPKK